MESKEGVEEYPLHRLVRGYYQALDEGRKEGRKEGERAALMAMARQLLPAQSCAELDEIEDLDELTQELCERIEARI